MICPSAYGFISLPSIINTSVESLPKLYFLEMDLRSSNHGSHSGNLIYLLIRTSYSRHLYKGRLLDHQDQSKIHHIF